VEKPFLPAHEIAPLNFCVLPNSPNDLSEKISPLQNLRSRELHALGSRHARHGRIGTVTPENSFLDGESFF